MPGATRRCKALGNPWAYADPDYKWDLEWDGQSGVLKDTATGSSVDSPRLSDAKGRELAADIASRGWMAKKMICENRTDVKARMLLGGQQIDLWQRRRERCQSDFVVKDMY